MIIPRIIMVIGLPRVSGGGREMLGRTIWSRVRGSPRSTHKSLFRIFLEALLFSILNTVITPKFSWGVF